MGAAAMPGNQGRAPAITDWARWLAVLDQYRVEYLILDPRHDGALLAAASRHPAWTVDYDDGESVLLARSSPAALPT
jgi:hypothetical protein